MIRRYELMVMLDPNQNDDATEAQLKKIEQLITSSDGGEIINTDKWGKKRLAYEVNGRPFGFYVVFEFMLDPALTGELERLCRLDALNLRHLLLNIPDKVIKLKEREKQLKSSLEERRRRMAEEAEETPVVDMLSAKHGEVDESEQGEKEPAGEGEAKAGAESAPPATGSEEEKKPAAADQPARKPAEDEEKETAKAADEGGTES